MSDVKENEVDGILNGPVFKFLEVIEQVPEEIIIMGPQAFFSWLKENMTDPTLLTSLEQLLKEHPELDL